MTSTLSERDFVRSGSWGTTQTAQSVGVTPRLAGQERLRRVTVEAITASLEAQLATLRALSAGWDSYGAPEIDEVVLARGGAFLTDILAAGLPAPHVVPSSKGGLTLEWQRGARELIVELVPDQTAMDAYFVNDDAGSEWELPLPADGLFIPALASMDGRH